MIVPHTSKQCSDGLCAHVIAFLLMSSRDQRSTDRPFLLIVDDNRDAASFLQRYLQHETGWEVVSTGSVAAAVAKLKERTPDAALLDYSLPDGTGIDVARELRAISPTIPIIIMS